MKFKILFIIALYTTFLLNVKAQINDILFFKSLINEEVRKVYPITQNKVLIIAGNNNEKIFKIIDNKIVIPIIFENNSLNKIQFTDCLILDTGKILLGTKQDFLYYIDNKTIAHLNQINGLNDSVIISINKTIINNEIELVTPHQKYKIIYPYNLRKINIKKIENKSIFKSIGKYLKTEVRLPAQEIISKFASELDYSFRPKKYIGDKELDTLKKVIRPGDLLIKRDDYFFSNVGIPGFWTHSGIYIGGKDEMDQFFKDIPMLEGEKPSDYILKKYPNIYSLIYNKKHLIIEAIGEGVSINPVEHIAKVDYLAVLRTKLGKEDIFKSLLTSFEFIDFPYDFLFDFNDDYHLVCSKLIYNSFKPSFDKKGINLVMSSVMGNPFISPSNIATQYSNEVNSENRNLNLVLFFDADCKTKTSFLNTEEEFCKTAYRKGK